MRQIVCRLPSSPHESTVEYCLRHGSHPTMAVEERYSVSFVGLCLAVLVVVGSLIRSVIYNIYFHPLASVPGPKLAGATYLYQTYFSLANGSRYYYQIGKLHKKYGNLEPFSSIASVTDAHPSIGPVVRITPDEVHLSDPDNYEVIYSVGTKYAKSPQFYDGFGIGYSTFSTGPNSVHRVRRARLDPFFSRRNVISLEHIVQSRAEKLTELVSAKLARKEAVDMHHAFRAISVDVITDYAFGESYHLLDTADLGREFFEMVNGIGPTMWVFQQWPGLQKVALSMPSAVAKAMNRSLKHVLNLQEVWQVKLTFPTALRYHSIVVPRSSP